VSTSQKAIFSLIITVLLFIVFVFFAFTGLFDLIEMRFYNPSITTHMVSENNRSAMVIEGFFSAIQNQLSEVLKTDVVRRGLMPEQDYEDYSALNKTFSLIKYSFDGVQWVRLIDSGGSKLHFSTYSPDIINYTYQVPFYSNYNEPDLPYDLIAVENGGVPKYTLDGKSGQILFSFPLYDSFDVYCGTALFSLSMDSILDKLFSEGRMVPGKAIILIQDPPGMVFGSLAPGEKQMQNQIASAWGTGGLKTARLSSSDSDANFILISTKTSQGLFIGSLIKEEAYLFPWNVKVILLACFFLTMYLTIFLLFSLKQEPVAIIQNRLKLLQVSLLEQFYELKDDRDWDRWIREMENRREEINALLKKGIRPASGDLEKEINILINKSWDELLSLLGSRREPGFDEEKLRSAINSILSALPKADKDLFPGVEGFAIQAETGKTESGLLGRASVIVKEIEEADLVEELDAFDGGIEDMQKPEALGNKKMAAEEPARELTDAQPVPSKVDLAALASQIEFSPEPEPETNEEDSIGHDLEIVSPFSAMLDSFTDTAGGEPEQEVETIQNLGQQLITRPFSTIGTEKIETLQAPPEGQTSKSQDNVIKEKEGLPFISSEALNPDNKEKDFINPDFKDLVDSVIKD